MDFPHHRPAAGSRLAPQTRVANKQRFDKLDAAWSLHPSRGCEIVGRYVIQRMPDDGSRVRREAIVTNSLLIGSLIAGLLTLTRPRFERCARCAICCRRTMRR